ncbi:SDR family NAD(P)-dependent oxidoreductase [Knoellia sp. Soil729]|uniref:SDR family NAD(P)-dependent oxidoreductase n=1 Tax=Knoellia sp. Soil729 TaxID=1736394 RepID=UPI0006F3BB2A|nr:SDR family NAD(P)-dependent oxidoreductase [Knoellia sp. Soil729]KRE40255.1 hypothetical protein ASG74_16585 [Knoellia sp. Soil729]
MSEHQHQKVVITGAAGVLGTWISQAFAREGAELLLTDRREDQVERLADELRHGGATVHVVESDLSTDQGQIELLAAIRQAWGSPDVLVNNAGIYPHGSVLETSTSDVRGIFEINVVAPFALSRGVAELMIEAGIHGSIVNIGSGAGLSPATGGAAYAASKAALHMFTRAFALELASFGIRVNTVQPGFAPGSDVSHLEDDYIEAMIRTIPLARTSGPGDAPEAVLFLCSPRASFVTGSTISVDGGRTAGTLKPMPAQTLGGR